MTPKEKKVKMDNKVKKVKKKKEWNTKLTTKKNKIIIYVIGNLIMSLDQESPRSWKVNNDTNTNNDCYTTPSENAAAAKAIKRDDISTDNPTDVFLATILTFEVPCVLV